MLDLSPKALDAQSEVQINRWVEVGSEEHRCLDDDPDLTVKWLRMGLKDAETPAFFAYDSFGRVWSAKPGDNGKYYPYHFECGKKLIGVKNSKVAVS